MIDESKLPDWAKQALEQGVIEFTQPQPDVTIQTHGPTVCAGEPCCIHNPTDHAMKAWPLVHRIDRGIVVIAVDANNPECKGDHRNLALSERICSHGQGHPDPDSMYFIGRMGGLVTAVVAFKHECDGCCETVYGDGQ